MKEYRLPVSIPPEPRETHATISFSSGAKPTNDSSIENRVQVSTECLGGAEYGIGNSNEKEQRSTLRMHVFLNTKSRSGSISRTMPANLELARRK